LKELNLKNSCVEDLTPVLYLPSLKYLQYADTPASQPPLEIVAAQARDMVVAGQKPERTWARHIGRISHLDFKNMPLTNLSGLTVFNKAIWLDLDDTKVCDLEPLSTIAELRCLFITRTLVRDLTPLKKLTALQMLKVAGSRISDIEPLATLASLSWLDLSDTDVSDLRPLRGLRQLRYLNLSRTQVHDLAPIRELPALKKVTFQSPAGNVGPAARPLHLTLDGVRARLLGHIKPVSLMLH